MKNKKFLVGFVVFNILLIPLCTIASTVEYTNQTQESVQEKVAQKEMTNEQVVKELVEKYGKKYNVSTTTLMLTLKNENSTFDFNRQSELTYKKNNRWGLPVGSREESYGVAQIHLPDHPNITKEQAVDPEFSIEFMAKMFSEGKQSMWMGYK